MFAAEPNQESSDVKPDLFSEPKQDLAAPDLFTSEPKADETPKDNMPKLFQDPVKETTPPKEQWSAFDNQKEEVKASPDPKSVWPGNFEVH